MKQSDSFWPEFARVAVPVTIQNVLIASALVIDQLMVGQLGATAVAAVGISTKITMVVVVALSGLGTGLSVFASRYWGAGEHQRIRRVLGLALAVGFAFTVLVTAIVAFFPAVVMAPFTTDQAVIEDGATFVRIIGLSYLPTMFTLVYSGVLRSTGMPRLPLIASAAATVVNLALDYVLIFGKWGFPSSA